MNDLDPRWEWIEVRNFGDAQPRFVKGYCKHLEVVPVVTLSVGVVAHLCQTCDTQLPAEWRA